MLWILKTSPIVQEWYVAVFVVHILDDRYIQAEWREQVDNCNTFDVLQQVNYKWLSDILNNAETKP